MNVRLKWIVIAVATLLSAILTFALGVWQLSRASQKVALQMEVDAQSTKPVLTAMELRAQPNLSSLVHRRAALRGSWVQGKTVYLDNRPMNSRVGFYVVTPFQLEGGDQVLLVQRGWLPRNFEERSAVPGVPTPSGFVEIEGRMAPAPGKLYELGTATAGVIRQNLDLNQFAAETGLVLMPITLQQTGLASDGLLRAWPSVNAGVDRHHGYAFQWFGLSALIVALYLWFQIVRRFIYRPKDTTFHV